MEVPEYYKRKIKAILMAVGGFFIGGWGFMIVLGANISRSFGSSVPEWQEALGIIMCVFGLISFLYGIHLWRKVTHIMWTRQAVREYGAPSIMEGKEVSKIKEDVPEQIKKLAELKSQGILTEEEFQKKKAELLAKL